MALAWGGDARDSDNSSTSSHNWGADSPSTEPTHDLLSWVSDPLETLYTRSSRLGKGGQGEVFLYKCKSPRTCQQAKNEGIDSSYEKEPYLAVKTMGSQDDDREYCIQLMKTVRGAGCHPSIHQTFYEQIPNGDMEFRAISAVCNGGDLHKLYKRYQKADLQLPEGFLWHVFTSLASTLDFLHNKCNPPILHRDLKPDNVLLHRPFLSSTGQYEGYPQVKITDFDISAFYDFWECPSGGGTPEFMPSEQLFEEGHPATPKSDVYGLGCIMHYLAGQGRPGDNTVPPTLWRRYHPDVPHPDDRECKLSVELIREMRPRVVRSIDTDGTYSPQLNDTVMWALDDEEERATAKGLAERTALFEGVYTECVEAVSLQFEINCCEAGDLDCDRSASVGSQSQQGEDDIGSAEMDMEVQGMGLEVLRI